jgi:KDO2-lipid IV(A) lauroyltransferase
MNDRVRKPLYAYWTPKYWPAWLAIGLLRLVCLLPYGAQLAIGKWLGRLAHRIGGTRRAIVRRNLALAFPELDEAERNDLALRHFESLGASLIELGLARWASDEWHDRMTTIEGIEHVERAVADGRGIIFLSAHFTTLELSGRKLRLNCPPFDLVYRAFRNELTTEFLRSTRERSGRQTIEKNDIKRMVRSLREGTPVWYAPDQSFKGKQACVIPFFGVPSMTNAATSTLARLGKAVVLPYFPRRLPEGGYHISIWPPLQNFPCGDAEEDTKQYVAVLEKAIRLAPDQYYWVHRKYKNLPEGYPDYYEDLDAWK